MVGDAGDDVGEPSLRVDAVEAGGLDERVQDGGSAAAVVGAGEEIVLAPEGERADGARSAALFVISSRPSSTKRVRASQREVA